MTDEQKESPIEWPHPAWGFNARLQVGGLLSGPETATEADLVAALTANPALRLRVLPQMTEWEMLKQHLPKTEASRLPSGKRDSVAKDEVAGRETRCRTTASSPER